jgi:hypothetical protein
VMVFGFALEEDTEIILLYGHDNRTHSQVTLKSNNNPWRSSVMLENY